MNLAPVALFTYNRIWHTQRTVEALLSNELASDIELFIYSDGPKTEADREQVTVVREYLASVAGFRKVSVIIRDRNLGLAHSIISGVTEIVNQHDRIIVLEDDMVTSPGFIRYMNEALELYKDDDQVISIHGYEYPVRTTLPDTFFLKGADCWGWATWKRGWELFEPDGCKLLHDLYAQKLTHKFDFDGSYPFTKQLADQVKGKNNSWAIRWYASAFLGNKLTLYPGKSLVQNIGNDGSGTHCEARDEYAINLNKDTTPLHRITIAEDPDARKAVGDFLKSAKSGFVKKIHKKFNKLARGMLNRGRKNNTQ